MEHSRDAYFLPLPLAEVAGSASRELRDPIRGRIAATALRSFPHGTFVTIDGTLAEEAADIAADYALRGMDAIYVAVARQYGCTLVTLDAEIEQRVGSIVTVQTPAALLAQLADNDDNTD
jgi:predicted nucleic acid-binding protein